ncbi:hypothetical protein [Metabacillus sp. 22489]|uniref:hypothetical protein n=1 Tax=Metabacillus sp. 22489 TaxID=3453928 RepID=UPI003F826912
MTLYKNNGNIGVNEFDLLVGGVKEKALEFTGKPVEQLFVDCTKDDYKLAFELLAKHVRGWADTNNEGSLLMNIVMEAAEEISDDQIESFMLIESALCKGAN